MLHHQNKMTIIFSIHIAPQRQCGVQSRGRVDNLITRDSRASFCGATLDCMQHWRGERSEAYGRWRQDADNNNNLQHFYDELNGNLSQS